MKKLFTLALLFLAHYTVSAQTVKYLSNGADLNAEITAGVAGDTYILGPGSYAVNTVITKRVTLIGPGYFNSSGPSGEAVITGTISLNSGSENSLITGLSFSNIVYLAANDLVFRRNKVVSAFFYIARTSLSGTQLAVNNLQILENYLVCTSGMYIYGAPLTNYTFKNNIISSDIYVQYNSSSSGSFINNIFGAGLVAGDGDNFSLPSNSSGHNVSFINNIFTKEISTSLGQIFSSANYLPNVFKYNVLINPSTGTGSFTVAPPTNNSFGNSAAAIFAGYPANVAGLALDEQYILSPSSPAKNFGRLSPYADTDPTTDAGAFGNASPYLNSGRPVGPYIYQLTVPNVAATNSVVPVTIKAKSNN